MRCTNGHHRGWCLGVAVGGGIGVSGACGGVGFVMIEVLLAEPGMLPFSTSMPIKTPAVISIITRMAMTIRYFIFLGARVEGRCS